MGANYKVIETPDAVRVELFGSLDEKGADALDAELSKVLAKPALKGVGVMFMMQGLSDCVESARKVLVRIQKTISTGSRRTAYVDERARFRGMALWVMHLAQDPNAKALATTELGLKWMKAPDQRETMGTPRVTG